MAAIPLTDPGDVKLYILCIMQNVGYPLEITDINDLALYDQIISNMAFVEAFDQLEEEGFIAMDKDSLYSITAEGEFIASTLKSDLNGYIHDRSLRAALQFIAFRKSGIKKDIEVNTLEDGRAEAIFSLKRKDVEFMNVRLVFDTEYQAKRAAYGFSEKPEIFYSRIIALLSGE